MRNKALLAILGSALISVGGKRTNTGSFGKKKNKLLDEFSSAFTSLIQALADEADYDDEDEIETISQCIDNRGCEDMRNSPESMAYAAFYWGFMIETGYADPQFRIEENIAVQAAQIRDRFIQICEATGYNPQEVQSISELDELYKLRWTHNWFNDRRLREDMFYFSMCGFILEKALRCIVCIASDKNLAEAYSKYLQSGHKITTSNLSLSSYFLPFLSLKGFTSEMVLRNWRKINQQDYIKPAPNSPNIRSQAENIVRILKNQDTENICFNVLTDLEELQRFDYIDISENWTYYSSIPDALESEGFHELADEIRDELEDDWELRSLSICDVYHGLRIEHLPEMYSTFGQYMKEAGSTLSDGVDLWWSETEIAIEERKEGQAIHSNAFKIGVNPIETSRRDRFIAELPMTDIVAQIEDEELTIGRILLVEYRDTNSLRSITANTPGRLCVGSHTQRYMDKLSRGEQRHFGVLAETNEGALHVMYHTHMDSFGTLANFTDAVSNSARMLSDHPRHHQETLRVARQTIERLKMSGR